MYRNLKEFWNFRQLVFALVVRHLNARYRGSALGFIWSFLNPLCLIAVYSLVFRYYIRFTEVEHYTLFLFVGLLPWIWFSSAALESSVSISSGGNLITKALFPPHLLPIVSVLTNLTNYILAVPLLLGFMWLTGIEIQFSVLLLPVIIILELVFLIGFSLGIASLNVYYRDIQHVLGNLMTLWFFLTPVLYPSTSIPEQFSISLLLNPIAIFTQMYHDILLDGIIPSSLMFSLALFYGLLAFIIGNLIFNHYREGFAELV